MKKPENVKLQSLGENSDVADNEKHRTDGQAKQPDLISHIISLST